MSLSHRLLRLISDPQQPTVIYSLPAKSKLPRRAFVLIHSLNEIMVFMCKLEPVSHCGTSPITVIFSLFIFKEAGRRKVNAVNRSPAASSCHYAANSIKLALAELNFRLSTSK